MTEGHSSDLRCVMSPGANLEISKKKTSLSSGYLKTDDSCQDNDLTGKGRTAKLLLR